ncbi:hypothetical protein BDK51DRAFT_52852 [Blyttiomyces helicus]|uniref:Uncharacterized protein n=1 Tax=Blyttiomyces helicus TaxID=388810 RepID=A0A4P9W823_9FUNG|nr:hypothetical protein BDK51DRAFT_52852 [Blyttiomyces helicus]|eukprot:RKO87573.1 hypothetical protein BDK51DRAFT_52852 [Blyttiomyces helicus]
MVCRSGPGGPFGPDTPVDQHIIIDSFDLLRIQEADVLKVEELIKHPSYVLQFVHQGIELVPLAIGYKAAYVGQNHQLRGYGDACRVVLGGGPTKLVANGNAPFHMVLVYNSTCPEGVSEVHIHDPLDIQAPPSHHSSLCAQEPAQFAREDRDLPGFQTISPETKKGASTRKNMQRKEETQVKLPQMCNRPPSPLEGLEDPREVKGAFNALSAKNKEGSTSACQPGAGVANHHASSDPGARHEIAHAGGSNNHVERLEGVFLTSEGGHPAASPICVVHSPLPGLPERL